MSLIRIEDLRFEGKLGREHRELVLNSLEVIDRVARGAVDDMEEDAAALDMAEKGLA